MCLYGRRIRNKKYCKNQKNGGIIPPVLDERALHIEIACGNCIECRQKRAREWQVRLQEDIKTNKNGIFITLTLSNESYTELSGQVSNKIIRELNTLYNIGYDNQQKNRKIKKLEEKLKGYAKDNEIAKMAIRRFVERWRKKFKKSVRHWLVTELGHNGTENIHLHGIIWTNESSETIKEIWNYGFIWTGYDRWKGKENYVNDETINYTVKYIHKVDFKHKLYKSIVLTSAGMGANYVNSINARNNKFADKETVDNYRTRNGHKLPLTTYWKNKLYTEAEKEKLWMNKLDEQKAYVCGEEINTKNGWQEYWKAIKHHRLRNNRLGYGSDKKNWQRAWYEEERRKKLQEARMI
ncbi:MAG: replication initiator protein [Microviridae sp.]|nr:MAG: replication initiator protein [Microviridae sp.]